MGLKEDMSERRLRKKYEAQIKINERQNEEIGKLSGRVSELIMECEKKDQVISSVMELRDDLDDTVKELVEKREEYLKMLAEIKEMRKVLDQTVFKGRWKLIRWLMR